MGRRLEEWRASHPEGTDEGNGNKIVQERGSLEMIGALQGDRAQLALTRSHTDEDRYWGRGISKSFPQEVTRDNRGSAGESMVTGDCAWGLMRPSGSASNGKDRGQADGTSAQLQCEATGGREGMDKIQERMAVPQDGNPDVQVLQKRKKKSKEKKQGQVNSGCHQGMEEGSFQDLYRGQSLEEEEETLQDSDIQGDSQLSISSAEATDLGTSEADLKEHRQEINGNKGVSIVIEGRGSKEDLNSSLGGMKDFSEEVPESSKHQEESPQSSESYRDAFRSPGNGSSGSAEGLETDPGTYSGGLVRDWDDEMEEKNCDPINYQHVQFMAQNCSSPAHQRAPVGQSSLEGCGTVEEAGTWCWCLHLYLGDLEGTPHVKTESADEGQSSECGYSMSSTLRVGEHRSENGGANTGDIPEPLTKKGGKMGETPELQEWVNWWQGWAGSCRAVSGHRRGKSAQAWGCRGEVRGEVQKQQDVWVLREWTRRDGVKRGENGPRVAGSEVWVLRNQEKGKQDSAWPLGKEDIWVPREPRRHRSAYFMADDTKWTPRSAKPGVSDGGEP